MRKKVYEIIFEAETPAGRNFDAVLIVAILLSLAATVLESVSSVALEFGDELRTFEFFITILFSIEYLLRIYAATHRWNYIKSFFGAIDLLAILPFYIGLLVPGAHNLAVIRGIRVLRIFRVFKLGHYSLAGQNLIVSVKNSWPKVSVFLTAVITLVFIMGAIMYVVEGPEAGFTSIPKSMYWAVVTMTTVGYGDLVPQTNFGQFVSMILMICGYAIIAVPTGIVSAEMTRATMQEMALTRTCPKCYKEVHRKEALFCYHCGGALALGK